MATKLKRIVRCSGKRKTSCRKSGKCSWSRKHSRCRKTGSVYKKHKKHKKHSKKSTHKNKRKSYRYKKSRKYSIQPDCNNNPKCKRFCSGTSKGVLLCPPGQKGVACGTTNQRCVESDSPYGKTLRILNKSYDYQFK